MSTVYVDDITLLSQSLLRVKETSYESASEEPGLSPRMTESNLYPLIRLPKNSLLLSGAKSQRSHELYIRDSALCYILVDVPVRVRIAIKSIIDILIAISCHLLSIGSCELFIMFASVVVAMTISVIIALAASIIFIVLGFGVAW